MTAINAYVTFNGNCREAMSFYQECLGGDLQMMALKDTPAGAGCPAGMENQIMHATLTKDGTILMGSDMVNQEGLHPGNNFSLAVNCSSEKEIHDAFNRIAAGGQVIDPLKEQFWGGIFGVIKDKFGIRWMFNFQKTPAA
ncbi:MAG: VOC family protein [Flavisolibacter sp.]